MSDLRKILQLLENQTDLPTVQAVTYSADKLEPSLSESAMLLHRELHEGYAKKLRQGDVTDFTLGGVELHNLFFEQFKEFTEDNRPGTEFTKLVERKFGSVEGFKGTILGEILALQGSGWVYLSTTGSIKTIENHKPADDVLLIVDCWEHAYILDYGKDRKAYFEMMWYIIDWAVMERRLKE